MKNLGMVYVQSITLGEPEKGHCYPTRYHLQHPSRSPNPQARTLWPWWI